MKLPVSESYLRPKVIDYGKYWKYVKDKISKTESYYNQHVGELPELKEGDSEMHTKSAESLYESQHRKPTSVLFPDHMLNIVENENIS